MIAGIGTDLVEIGRIEEMLHRGSRLTRIFTTTELACAKDNAATLARGLRSRRFLPGSLPQKSAQARTVR